MKLTHVAGRAFLIPELSLCPLSDGVTAFPPLCMFRFSVVAVTNSRMAFWPPGLVSGAC